MSIKKCRRDTMILLFTSAITSAFAECRRELERLHIGILECFPGKPFFSIYNELTVCKSLNG